MNSKIILAKGICMDKQYTNVLSYSENQMLSLLRENSHLIAEASNYSFMRQTGTIMVGFTYSQCLQANYIAFQNPNYSNKWFFAWVDDVVYKGDNNTEIIFTIDAWSTFYDNWQPKKCFINRQHTNDDTIGANTIPENLDVGEVIQEDFTEDDAYTTTISFWIAIASNWTINDNSSSGGEQNEGVFFYNKTVFGTKIFLFKITNATDIENVGLFIIRTNGDGHIDDIKNIFIVPSIAINEAILTEHTASIDNNNFTWYTTPYNITPTIFNTTITKRHSFSDYLPKNGKCFCYPYNYLFVSNNQGSNNIYKYEDFTTNSCVFENQFAITIGGSGRLVPKNYKNMLTNDDEALPLGKYPVCEWSSDAYTNWLTQNGVNLAVNLALMAGGIGTSTATFNATKKHKNSSIVEMEGNIAMNIASYIGETIGSFYQASLLPNISGGQATGDIIFTCDKNCFTFREMRAKTEYLKIIDDYFTRFGYAVRKLEMPHILGRTYWNYVEIGASEEIGYGTVPSKYMDIINNACRKGVTIWHSHSNIGDFSLNNTIVT